MIPETDNKIPDILDETAYELDWMTSMVVKPDEPTWGEYAGLVYSEICENRWTGLAIRPYDYEREFNTARIVKPPTFASTLNYVACAAQAARLWEPYDAEKSAFYLDEAKKSYAAYEKGLAADESTRELFYVPGDILKTGSLYDEEEVNEDAYWAACELFVSAKKLGDQTADEYYKKLSGYKNAFEVTTKKHDEKSCMVNTLKVGYTNSAGSLSLVLNKELLGGAEAKKLEASIITASDKYVSIENEQGYGIPYSWKKDFTLPNGREPWEIPIDGYERGSNAITVNNAIIMAYAYDLTKDVKYINGVTTAMDYLLGTNPLSFSYITGYGTYSVKNPSHKYWSFELDKTLPCAPDGVLSGGPNVDLQDDYVKCIGFVPGAAGNPSQRCYVDSVEAWSTNEAAINWNSPLAWVVSFIQDEVIQENPKTDKTDTTEPKNVTETTNSEDISDTFIYGDIDENGKIEITDLTHLSLHLLKDKILTGNALKAADVTGNGNADLAHLKQFVSLEEGIVLGPVK